MTDAAVVDQSTQVRDASVPARDEGRTEVLVSRTWAGALTSWQRTTLEAINASEGLHADLGTATFEAPYGPYKRPEDLAGFVNLRLGGLMSTLDGWFVLVLLRLGELKPTAEAPATIPAPTAGNISIGGWEYTPIWAGRMVSHSIIPDGSNPASAGSQQAGGLVRYTAQGIGAVLNDQVPAKSHELNEAGDLVEHGELLIFNDRPRGDCSDGLEVDYVDSWTYNDEGGSVVEIDNKLYAFDRVSDRAGAAPSRWLAGDVVQYLLNAVRVGGAGSGAPRWNLRGNLGALIYDERWDLRGMTLYQALCRVINPRRGVTFRCKPVYDTTAGEWRCEVLVDTLTANEVTSGSLTAIPASLHQQTLDHRDDLWLDGGDLSVDSIAAFDEIRVLGDHPLVTCTLRYEQDGTGDLVKGWTAAQETAWDAAVAAGDDEALDTPALRLVWRRFILREGWDCKPVVQNSTAAALHLTRSTAGTAAERAAYGENGYTGDRIYAQALTTITPPPRAALRFARTLTLPEGVNWDEVMPAGTATLPTTVSLDKEPAAPLVFIGPDPGTAATGSVTQYQDGELQVIVEDDAPAVQLGQTPDDAQTLHDTLTDSVSNLWLTVAIREPLALEVSWRRPQAQLPSASRRTMAAQLPGLRQWRALKGTWCRLVDGAPKILLGEDKTIIDDTDALRDLLALARLRHEFPALRHSWSEVGRIAYQADDFAPGELITQLHAGGDTWTGSMVITSRAWDFRAWRTSWSAERIDYDLEVLA